MYTHVFGTEKRDVMLLELVYFPLNHGNKMKATPQNYSIENKDRLVVLQSFMKPWFLLEADDLVRYVVICCKHIFNC